MMWQFLKFYLKTFLFEYLKRKERIFVISELKTRNMTWFIVLPNENYTVRFTSILVR